MVVQSFMKNTRSMRILTTMVNKFLSIKMDGKRKEYNFDKEFHRNQLKDEKVVGPTINQINLSDILIIKNWIAYANLIEDNSVFKIFGEEIRSNYINETIKDQINYRRNN